MSLKRITSIIAAIALLAIAACSTPPTITNSPTQNVVAAALAPQGSTIATGLQDAAYDLDNAIAIGVLQPDDQAAACVHSALKLAGLEVAPGTVPAKSFTPRVSDAISGGAVLYIQSVQMRNQTPFQVSAGCKGVIGDLVLQGLQATAAVGASLIPGGNLLKAIPVIKGM